MMTDPTSELRIGVDLDGVVADFNHGWIQRYNRDFGTALSGEDIQEWDAPVDLTHFNSMDCFWDWAETCGEGRSVFRWLRPYPGSLEAIAHLADLGHKIVILTTKPDFAITDTYAWLSEQGIRATEVHILDHKSDVDCDVYIDDADHSGRSLSRLRPTAAVLRYVRPWNNPVEGAIDVHSWSEIVEFVVGKA